MKSEIKRCPKGTRKNKKTGICEKYTLVVPIRKEPPMDVVTIRKEPPMVDVPIKKEPIYNVIIRDPTEYIITTNSNKVNNSTIFKVKHQDCIRHFFVPDRMLDFEFLFIDAHMEKTGILVLMNKDIEDDTMESIAEFIEKKEGKDIDQRFLTNHKIIRLQWNSQLCEKKIIISKKTKAILQKLNELLTAKCDNLSLSLDYVYNMNGDVASYSSLSSTLLLCLNHPEKGCISSIELLIHGDNLMINSKTKPEFEGKKYNKLLRAATIILAPLLDCDELASYAVNSISTWLLMDSFNAVTTDEKVIEFLFNKGVLTSKDPDQMITKDVFTKQLIREFHEDEEGEIDLEIDLTDPENIRAAKDVFRELVTTSDIMKEIKCH